MNKISLECERDMQARHIDNGYRLTYYAEQSIVCCIECDTVGKVENEYQYRIESERKVWCAKFVCKHCQLSLVKNEDQADWVGQCNLIGDCPCSFCGTRLTANEEIISSYKQALPSTIAIDCSNCGKTNTVPVERANKYQRYDARLAIDADFGLPLFLQVPCRFGKIWAFNQNHLTELHSYINATLRERTADAGNASMPSRLPNWMKSAKNREMINKKLTQLQSQLDRYENKHTSKK